MHAKLKKVGVVVLNKYRRKDDVSAELIHKVGCRIVKA